MHIPLDWIQLKFYSMSVTSFWAHGNLVIAETEENFIKKTNFGWGTEIELLPRTSTWFHYPLPTPSKVLNEIAFLQTFYLLFYSHNCQVKEAHIYDGSIKIQEFKDIAFEGEQRFIKTSNNTFKMNKPYEVFSGLSISFCVATAEESGARMIISSAGADYKMVKREFESDFEEEE